MTTRKLTPAQPIVAAVKTAGPNVASQGVRTDACQLARQLHSTADRASAAPQGLLRQRTLAERSTRAGR